ncbi:MAG: DNA internalization-related competence protein ComEC/Rec2 [Nitrospirae bacterium]|nr:DNA internalization-related competence protein ComEC/Rec2 [Nitrospirota bacterium]
MHIFIPFISGVALFHLHEYFPHISALCALSAVLYSILNRKLLLVPVIALGVVYAFFRFSPPPDSPDIHNRDLILTGRFVPGKDQTLSGQPMKIFRPESVIDEDSGEEVPELDGRDITLFSEIDADEGSNYELTVKMGKDRSRLDPGWDGAERLSGRITAAEEKGPAADSLRHAFEAYRDRLNRYLRANLSGDAAALTASITTGDMSYLDDHLRQAFNVTGLAHILSISGSHFGMFSVLLYGTFLFLIKRLPYGVLQRFTLYLSPSQAAAVITLPFMVFYLGLSGASPPAVRSFVMIGLFLVGLLVGRRGQWLNTLSLAAFILILFDPEVVLSLSFLLSFFAVLFIGAAAERNPGDDDMDQKKDGAAVKFVKGSLLITLAATLGTAPLVAYKFHYLSLISPLANLIASPLIGALLVAFSLISSFSFLLTGHFALKPLVSLTADLSVWTVKSMAMIPYADIKISAFAPAICIGFYAAFLLYFAFGRRKAFLIAPLLPLAVGIIVARAAKDDLSVTFLDVGQGDSAVVSLPDKKTIVIDTGRTGKETAAFLRFSGKKYIDALVLTHEHPDHSGGGEYLLERYGVREIWKSSSWEAPSHNAPPKVLKSVSRGDTVEGADYTISVLHPYEGFYTMEDDEGIEQNNGSVVLRISGQNHSFLFPGDVEREAEEDLAHLGGWLRSDVLKVPHHGGRTSSDAAFISAVSPSVAVISVGRDNTFGHPSAGMLDALSGTRTLRTDLDGAVKITSNEKGLEIKTYRDFALEKADSLQKELRNIRRLFETW